MPFISKDWRSPGEIWVKTREGWEKKKVLECSNQQPTSVFAVATVSSPLAAANESQTSSLPTQAQSSPPPPPHCQILIKPTKEIAGFNEFHEAVKRLDFCNAVRDVRRFNYVCALLDHLIGHRAIYLSGCSRKVLLAIVEEIAKQVFESKNNPDSLRRLLHRLDSMLTAEKDSFWGGPQGSQMLWTQHASKISEIASIANRVRVDFNTAGDQETANNTTSGNGSSSSSSDSSPNPSLLLRLPEECVREIILRLSRHEDLTASSAACSQLERICNEQRVWKELTTFYFTGDEIAVAVSEKKLTDWKLIYNFLKRMYGLREDRQFAETLSLCRHCRCLFWESLGHPCIADQCPEYQARLKECGGPLPPSPVPPSQFLKFFSL